MVDCTTNPVREKRAIIAALWLGSVLFACGITIADPDLWGHTLYGLRCLDGGFLVEKSDPFSYTAPGAAWINHEWLTEYQFGWLWRHAGNAGLWMWRNVMVLLVFGAVACALRQARASLAAAAVVLVFGSECLGEFVAFVRPQLATFALFAVTFALLRSHWERPRRWIWVLPPVLAIWVNLHGGFLAGLGILALFTFGFGVRAWKGGREWRLFAELAAVSIAAIGATFVNPYGITLHSMLWDHLIPEQAVREWQPLWKAPQSLSYYVPFVLAALALPGWRRLRGIDLFVLAVVASQAVSHIRHVALLCITVMILLPGPLSESLPRLFGNATQLLAGPRHRRRRWLATATVVVAMLAVREHDCWWMAQYGIRPWDVATEVHRDVPGVPAKAVSLLLDEGITGNLVTDYGWGQYVLWHLHPASRVAFDGRYRTVYPADLEREFLAFQRAAVQRPQRTALLDDYDTEIVLLPAHRGPCAYVDSRPEWVQVFSDDQAVLYLRDVPRFQAVIAKSRAGRLAVREVSRWQQFPAGPGGDRGPGSFSDAQGVRNAARRFPAEDRALPNGSKLAAWVVYKP